MATTKSTSARSGTRSSGTRAKASTSKSSEGKSTAAKSTAAKSTPVKPTATKAATRSTSAKTAPRAKSSKSLVARTGRTIKERPYTSAAIATGAVVGVAAAAAAGAFFVSRRDKSFKEASDELTTKVKDGFASASESVKDGLASATETVKDGFASASSTVKDLGQRGADYLKGDDATSSAARSQREIAEEALSLKATGETSNPAEALSSTEIKAGAISY